MIRHDEVRQGQDMELSEEVGIDSPTLGHHNQQVTECQQSTLLMPHSSTDGLMLIVATQITRACAFSMQVAKFSY